MIPELLNSAQLEKIHELLAGARFVDGKLTAGMAARKVKKNEEMVLEPELLLRCLVRDPSERLHHIADARVAVGTIRTAVETELPGLIEDVRAASQTAITPGSVARYPS